VTERARDVEVMQRNGMRVLTFTMPRWGIWNKIIVTVERGARAAEHDLPILVLLGCRMTLEAVSSTGG
jgi:hypothetical protein